MHVPAATYRLQLNRTFQFKDVMHLLPYLAQLGISDLYASPIFQATQGSTHGYDVTDPTQLNPEWGTPADFEALTRARQSHGLGWIQDIVPNHMAFASENLKLMDLLERGPYSPYYAWFDVFRDHPDPELRQQIVAPFLGCAWETALRTGEVKLVLDQEGLAWRYYERRFPLSLPSYETVLLHKGELLAKKMPDGNSPWSQWKDVNHTISALSRTSDSPAVRTRLHSSKQRLWCLYQGSSPLREHVDAQLQLFCADPDSPLCQGLCEQQFYRLTFWQDAAARINYRRFFYLNDYIALRIEDPSVFFGVHERILDLVQRGVFTGLRVDHLDGLYDPKAYLQRLRQSLPDVYLVAEKILELDESLPEDWPLQGTSGYQFAAYLNGLFCQGANESALTALYHDFIGATVDFPRQLYAAKQRILESQMAGELTYLTGLFIKTQASGDCRDPGIIRQALCALMAAFPVYRSYRQAGPVSQQDRAFIETAVQRAGAMAPVCKAMIAIIGDMLSSTFGPASEESKRQHFIRRFQQFTGPAMAKGFEDTLLYGYNRLTSVNEVGSDPTCFGISLKRFHAFNIQRAQHWPQAMNATSTHDTKRGEDVRARLNVLSEIPQRWRDTVMRWAELSRSCKSEVKGDPAPDRNDEYLIYQTLVGAWPFDNGAQVDFQRRLQAYLVKAVREAKVHSTWTEPHAAYEAACHDFVDRLWDRHRDQTFWDDFLPFQQEIALYGVYNSLSQTLLKMTCPGVPDFYQGAECWDLNLVDPDNRRPVDFQQRQQYLEILTTLPAGKGPKDLLEAPADGRVKLFLIHQGLHARARYPALFAHGAYQPVKTTGTRAQHIVAFIRQFEGMRALTVVPRFLCSVASPDTPPLGQAIWQDTAIHLPEQRLTSNWDNVLTGQTLAGHGDLSVGQILSAFPVALLISKIA